MSDIDNHQRGPIHMAVEGDFSTILSVLLEHVADPDFVDENANNGESPPLVLLVYIMWPLCGKVI